MGKATKLKKLRRLAERATKHLDAETYTEAPTRKLGECTKGAYKALKSGKFKVINHEV